jgi:hypothetical protein
LGKILGQQLTLVVAAGATLDRMEGHGNHGLQAGETGVGLHDLEHQGRQRSSQAQLSSVFEQMKDLLEALVEETVGARKGKEVLA